jgi:inosine/xanthosine triphosphatase
MNTIVITVGSTRRPKLEAVREALAILGPSLHDTARFDVAGVEVPSGVRHTPLSREEIMAGARQRVESLRRIARENNESWRYFIGLEGGLDIVRERAARWVFLENWAYVADRSGRSAFGQSGAVLLPDPLVKRVVDEGVELAEAMDAFAGAQGIRDAQGAWGVLTRNRITRQDAIRVSVINAFAPFLSRAVPSRAGIEDGI